MNDNIIINFVSDREVKDSIDKLLEPALTRITFKEAFAKLLAGEVVQASLINNPMYLNSFKIDDAMMIKNEDGKWEWYHCAINTMFGFSWYIQKPLDLALEDITCK
jgi:hypothetical protein